MNFSTVNASNSSINGTRPLLNDTFYLTISGIFNSSALIVNCLVMIHSIRNRRAQNTISHLVRNLLLANILISFIWVIATINMIIAKQIGWPFPLMHYTCKLAMVFWLISYTASVETLTLLSIERYNAILHPTRPRLQGLKLNIILVIVWVSSIIVSIPITFITSVDKVVRFDCLVQIQSSPTFHFFHIIFLDVADYILPTCIMMYCYTRVIIRLQQTSVNTLRNKNKSLSAGERRKKQVIKKLICLTVCFILSALPWIYGFNLTLIQYSQPPIPQPSRNLQSENLTQLIPLLFFLSLFYDPIFYVLSHRNGGNSVTDNNRLFINQNKKIACDKPSSVTAQNIIFKNA